MYTDVADVTGENALSLLYASKKYAIQQLVDKCLALLTDGQSIENVCSILEQSHFYNEEDYRARSLVFICQHASNVLQTTGFLELCRDCITKIVASDTLQCDERVVFEAVTKWAEHQCDKSGLDNIPEVLRTQLGGVLYLVRFPTMDSEYFTDVVSDSLLLNDAEKVELFKSFYKTASKSKESGNLFNEHKRDFVRAAVSSASASSASGVKRKGSGAMLGAFKGDESIQICMRFNTVSEDESWYVDAAEPDAIAFQANVNVYMHGILVYGSYIGEGMFDVQTTVRDSSDNLLVRYSSTIKTSEYQLTYTILFDEAIKLQRTHRYVVAIQVNGVVGVETYMGRYGNATVHTGNSVTFTFYKTRYSVNGTDVKTGQIPGILFSVLSPGNV